MTLCLILSGCVGGGGRGGDAELPWASSGRLLPTEGRWTLIRLEEDGTIPVGDERVTPRALVDDGKMRLRSLSRGERPDTLRQLYLLEENLDVWPVIIETPARTDVLKLMELVEQVIGDPPPYPINFFLKVRTPEGVRCVGIPVLFCYKYALRKDGPAHPKAVHDERPFDWYFFWENRIVGYDDNPAPPPEGRELLGELWISPLDSDAFMVWADQSWFDLVEGALPGPLFSGARPVPDNIVPRIFRYRKGAAGPREQAAMLMLSGTPEGMEKRRMHLEECRPLRGSIERFLVGWHVVPGWDYVEELAARMTGPGREISFTNLIVRYVLYPNSPRPTVQDFVRILELARRYGAKGVFTDLPRRGE